MILTGAAFLKWVYMFDKVISNKIIIKMLSSHTRSSNTHLNDNYSSCHLLIARSVTSLSLSVVHMRDENFVEKVKCNEEYVYEKQLPKIELRDDYIYVVCCLLAFLGIQKFLLHFIFSLSAVPFPF